MAIEQAVLAWLETLGRPVKHHLDIAPGELAAERTDFGEVTQTQQLQDAPGRLNPQLPVEVFNDFPMLTNPEGPTLEARKRPMHQGVFSI